MSILGQTSIHETITPNAGKKAAQKLKEIQARKINPDGSRKNN